MPTRRTQQPESDLFTAAAATKTLPPKAQVVVPTVAADPASPSSPRRHLLPKDLPGALVRLDDAEFDTLFAAVMNEGKRRDRLPSILKSKSMAVEQRLHDVPKAKSQVAPASHSELALTRGQMNAIRAAFEVSVKPSVIARQFGISQSDVRKALTSDTRQRKF